MTYSALKRLLDAQPFKPFRLRMPDGRALRIPHPEFVSSHPEMTGSERKGRTIVVWEASGEEFNIVDLDLVSDLEPDPRKGASSKKSKR